jgi:DNA topoisomerase I
MSNAEIVDLAEEAGLVYLDDATPGIRRVRRGRGFSYIGPDGDPVDEESRERARSLTIPPAWTDVWIASNPDSHLLATGFDKAGRKQYVYHPVWEELRDDLKFSRLADFGKKVGKLRRTLDRDLRRNGLPRRRVVALAVAVLDRTLIRVGNRRYANENDSYGLTTLTNDHVEISGHHIHFEFAGKGGAEHQLALRDRRLANLILKCQDLSGQTLFSYENGSGPAAVTSTDINDYLSLVTGSRFTAKDFRTWGASSAVAGQLAISPGDAMETEVLDAIDLAASKLGNTRAVCRSAYVHPEVIEAFSDGRLAEAWKKSRTGLWLDRQESALNRVLH